VTVFVETDNAGRFAEGVVLRADDLDLEVISARLYRDRGLIVEFAGVTDRDAAEALRGRVLTITAEERRQLEDGEFWPDQLSGLEVVDPHGKMLGIVADVVVGQAQDRLVVRIPDGTLVEVPFVEGIVGDPEGGRIVIDAPEGMF